MCQIYKILIVHISLNICHIFTTLPEAEKLKTFRRADFCLQNFPDVNSNFATKIVNKLIFAIKVHNWNIKGEFINKQKMRLPTTLKCSRSKTIRRRKLKSSHHVDFLKVKAFVQAEFSDSNYAQRYAYKKLL